MTVPSSLHEANKPFTRGFQLSPFTSNVSALATALKHGWSTSPDELSSANICMLSSPPADAMSPVSRHLTKDNRLFIFLLKLSLKLKFIETKKSSFKPMLTLVFNSI